MGKILEGVWDCKYCGHTQIRGSIAVCPHCGKPRDENTRFYLPRKRLYVSEETAKQINKNPDWICLYCNRLVSDNLDMCPSCGAPRTSENMNYFENQKKQEEKIAKRETSDSSFSELQELDDFASYSKENSKIDEDNSPTQKEDSFSSLFHSKGNRNWTLPLAITASFLVVLLLFFLLMPKEKELTVQSFSWKRSIAIERFQTVTESAWYLPSNARLLYTMSEFHHYQQVLDHYETRTREISEQVLVGYEEYVSGTRDLGNGYFEEVTSTRPIYETHYRTETYEEPVYRDEPVYQTKYYYEIDKWLYERSVTTSGLDHAPYWGEVNLASDERTSTKGENYFIIAIDKNGNEQTISLSYEDWSSLEIGQTISIEVSIFGTGKLKDLSSNAQVFQFFTELYRQLLLLALHLYMPQT